jgi:carbamoyl-phosphate synthase small subunit
MLGKIEFENEEIEFYDPNKVNLVAQASSDKVETYGNGEYKIVLVDCGVKNNIIRCLLNRNATVIRVPWDYDFNTLEYDGLFLTNGPGDPAMCEITVKHIKTAIEEEKPIMGICLGNQLLGLAAGGTTYKLKYGHRSHNQPVLLQGTNRCFITSQNHGFAIDDKTLPEEWEPLFVNVNDNTNEGIRHKTKPFFSTQFHPEASSGPVDTEFLFDDFIENVKNYKSSVVNPQSFNKW